MCSFAFGRADERDRIWSSGREPAQRLNGGATRHVRCGRQRPRTAGIAAVPPCARRPEPRAFRWEGVWPLGRWGPTSKAAFGRDWAEPGLNDRTRAVPFVRALSVPASFTAHFEPALEEFQLTSTKGTI